jgi:hypothetical protein
MDNSKDSDLMINAFLEGHLKFCKEPKVVLETSSVHHISPPLQGCSIIYRLEDRPKYVGALIWAFPVFTGAWKKVLDKNGEMDLGDGIDALYVFDFASVGMEEWIRKLPHVKGMVISDVLLPSKDITEHFALICWEHNSYF